MSDGDELTMTTEQRRVALLRLFPADVVDRLMERRGAERMIISRSLGAPTSVTIDGVEVYRDPIRDLRVGRAGVGDPDT